MQTGCCFSCHVSLAAFPVGCAPYPPCLVWNEHVWGAWAVFCRTLLWVCLLFPLSGRRSPAAGRSPVGGPSRPRPSSWSRVWLARGHPPVGRRVRPTVPSWILGILGSWGSLSPKGSSRVSELAMSSSFSACSPASLSSPSVQPSGHCGQGRAQRRWEAMGRSGHGHGGAVHAPRRGGTGWAGSGREAVGASPGPVQVPSPAPLARAGLHLFREPRTRRGREATFLSFLGLSTPAGAGSPPPSCRESREAGAQHFGGGAVKGLLVTEERVEVLGEGSRGLILMVTVAFLLSSC